MSDGEPGGDPTIDGEPPAGGPISGDAPLRSGLISVVGRPNVGKSSLVNAIVGHKVTITSPRPNTTRRSVRAVLRRPGAQAVFVDTPGLHRPRSALGRRLNEHIADALDGIDVVVAVLDATMPIGPGDRMVLGRASAARAAAGGSATAVLVAVNKVDRARPEQVLAQLDAAWAALDRDPAVDCFGVSARTGDGVEGLADAVCAVLLPGPPYFPEGMDHDLDDAFWVAELVREQLLARMSDELPHAIACRVVTWEWPRIEVEILVERESQKGIVIGRHGELLKFVGTAVRRQLAPGAFLELRVRVAPRWQERPDAIERFGY